MKALIFENKVIDVVKNPFEVHESMFWVDCPNECKTGNWKYISGQFIPEKIQLTYAQLRIAEYPPMADYLDAIVKNDKEQLQAYIAACLAVKAKYPKATAGV